MWAKSENGTTTRAYAYADTNVYQVGTPSITEKQWNLFEEGIKENIHALHPGAEELIEMAKAWIQIDPTKISSNPDIKDTGWLISI